MTVVDFDFAGTPPLPVTAPGPKGLPFLGVLPNIKGDPLNYFVNLAGRYGDAVPFRLGVDKVLLVSHPAGIRHVLQDNRLNYRKSKYFKELDPILKGGLVVAEDAEWKAQRQCAAKGFTGALMKKMVAEINRAVSDRLDHWQERRETQPAAAEGRPLEVVTEMMHLTLDIALRALLGSEVRNDHETIYAAVTDVLKIAEKRIWAILKAPAWIPTRDQARMRAAREAMQGIIFSLIDRRCQGHERKDDLLDVLIEGYGGRDLGKRARAAVKDQLMTVIAAGHDTTSNALAWTWYLLARHKAVQDRVRDEVETVLGGREPTFEDLERLRYTRAVLLESMRLYPPVWTFSRVAAEEDRIDGQKVEPGTTVMISPYVVHRRPGLWSDPEAFDPERFLRMDLRGIRHSFNYLPFGAGPRVCLGARFAEIESLVVLARVVQRFGLRLSPGQVVEPEPMITLRPRGGLLMDLVDAA